MFQKLALSLDEAKPDGLLLAGRYTLLDYERALERLMPTAAAKNVDIVIGGPYSSGVLAGGTHFEYQKAPPEIIAKVERIKMLADRDKVPIKADALQFSLPQPVSAAVIPGASRPERIKEGYCQTQTPDALPARWPRCASTPEPSAVIRGSSASTPPPAAPAKASNTRLVASDPKADGSGAAAAMVCVTVKKNLAAAGQRISLFCNS